MAQTIARLASWDSLQWGISVLPQSVHQLGYRQQGKTPRRRRILAEAIALEEAGVCSRIEHIPTDLGLRITQKLTIPTIGIEQVHTVMVRY